MMRIKAIARLCQQEKSIVILERVAADADGVAEITQYIGTNSAVYMTTDWPTMTQENIFAIFDVSDKQRDRTSFRLDRAPDLMAEEYQDERPAEIGRLLIGIEGMELMPVYVGDAVYWLNANYLRPLDCPVAEITVSARRTEYGKICFYFRCGLYDRALIYAYDADLTNVLGRLAECSRIAGDMRQREEA